ncbi:MAG TPA: NmrA/HSCARG family protein [Gammaproteobacteria bacterium]
MSRNTIRMLLVAALLAVVGTAFSQENEARIILVTGATGTQGGAVARELNARGYRVRGLTRNPDSAASRQLAELGIEMVRGDFDDPESLDAALEGAYGAFSVQQYRGVGVDGEIRQGKAFADAAKRAGVEHFVYTSVAKAALDTGVPQFDSKLVIEDYIGTLGIPYTILRPASFMSSFEAFREEAAAGEFWGPLPPELARVYIAPRDIGRFAAEAFDRPEQWLGTVTSIAGDRISYADIAAAMSRVMGTTVVYRQIPWDEYVESATDTAIAREQWYMENTDPVDVEALREQYDWLMSMEDYLVESGWGEPLP